MNKKDIHIEVLKYARDNPGFTLDDLENVFPTDYHWIRKEIQHSKIFQTSDTRSPYKYHISFDDRFKLLEYEELKDARASSRKAMTVAIISILLTFGGLCYQFFVTSSVEVTNITDISCQKNI